MSCTICKSDSTPDGHAVWVCMQCVQSEAESGEEWIAMVRRFLGGKPRQGESFSVVRQVISSDGSYFALELIGSTYVTSRVSIAKQFDSERLAREELGV